MTDDGLGAALIKLGEVGERLALLEARVTGNLDNCEATTAGLGGAITDVRALAEQQGALIDSLAQAVAKLTPPDDSGDGKAYTPRPAIHWWSITEAQRQVEADRLAAWVEQVWRPFYGHLATMLGSCWREHPLCLVGLDWLSELHSVLYFQPKRTASLLSAQAEFQTRIAPTIAEQFRAETSRCTHRQPADSGRWAGPR